MRPKYEENICLCTAILYNTPNVEYGFPIADEKVGVYFLDVVIFKIDSCWNSGTFHTKLEFWNEKHYC